MRSSITKGRALPALVAVTGLLAGASTASAAPPANDQMANAAAIGAAPEPVAGSLLGATRELGEPDHGEMSVWYAWTATEAARMVLDRHQPIGFATAFLVYVRGADGTLNAVHEPADLAGRVHFDATPGQRYLIAVTSPGAIETDYALWLRREAVPDNDAFAAAERLRIPGRYIRTAADAGTELGEPAHGGPPQRTVWYRLTPAASSRFTLETYGPAGTRVVAVYTGPRLDALAPLASAINAPVRFFAHRGRTYHVAVDIPAGSQGGFTLEVSDGSLAAKGVKVAVVAGQTVESVRSRGLRLLVGTWREARVDLELRVSRATARALGLRSQVLGRARGRLEPAQKLPAAIELSAEARRALLGGGALRATLRVSLQNPSAPNRTRDIAIRLAG